MNKNIQIKKPRFNRGKRIKKRLPLVSIVMPVYNAEKYVSDAITSILKQTYKRIELIIVDDESTDDSLKIIMGYKRRYRSKITLIHSGRNLNRGGDMCANLGIEKARGKYIARMDADDIAVSDRIEKQVAFLEENKRVFLVGSNAYVIDTRGKVIGEKLEPHTPSDIYRSYATFHPLIHPTVMLRRVFGGVNFSYQIKYSANNDYYTFFKLICKGYIFVNLNDKLLHYRIHDKNDTFVHIKKKYLNTLKIRLEMVSSFNYRPNLMDIAVNILQGMVLMTLPERAVKNIYLITKGIIKPPKVYVPFFGRLKILPAA